MKEVIGNSDNSFTFDTSYNKVFCYGKEVDDFHTLDKNKLFALNFSATQELDKLHHIQKNKIIELKHTVAELQKEINYLQLLVKGDKIGIQLKKTIAELQKEMYYLQEQDKNKFDNIEARLKELET